MTRSVASGGASADNGAVAAAATAALASGEEEGVGRGQNGGGLGRGAASRPGYAGRPGGRSHVADVRPPRGRRRVE